jgi:exodeoxyribonuclease VII large subunit
MGEPALSDGVPPSREALTVSALNRAVAALLARGFPLVLVRGEVGNLTRAASGHWYFTLKDDAAQARCVMFRSRNALVPFSPREGDQIEIRAQVGLYEPRGEFQLTVESIQRAGQGRLFEEFLRLKNRLAAEGLFDDACKRPLPALPRAVGVVTSLQAAALRDVMTTLTRRAPYARIVVYPVPVQGTGAGERIAAMLAAAGARAEVDVLLLVRGGGSLEDLWAFNEEVVARALRACPLPVVVGVGHESDFTIADFAADLRAPTPTAAAELVAPEHSALRDGLVANAFRLRRYAQLRLQEAEQRLDYALRVLLRPNAPLRGLRMRVDDLHARLRRALREALAVAGRALSARRVALDRRRPDAAGRRLRLEALQARAAHALARRLDAHRADLHRLRQALSHLDPHAVLARGFALAVAADGRIATDAARLAVGAPLAVHLARGRVQTRIEGIAPDDGAGEGQAAAG